MHHLVGATALRRQYEEYLEQSGAKLPSRQITREHLDGVFEEIARPNPDEPGAHAWRRDMKKWSRRHKKRTVQLEGRNYNELLLRLCSDICFSMDELGWTVSTPVFAAEFPTGYANACVKTTDCGALILVNTGLIDLLYRFSKYVSVSRQLRSRFGEKPCVRSVWNGTVWDDSPYPSSEVAFDAGVVLLRYLFYSDASGPCYFRWPGGVSAFWSLRLLNASERFVVGHEIAHLQIQDERDSSNGGYPGNLESSKIEHVADLRAVQLVLASATTIDSTLDKEDESSRFLAAATAVSAPFFFLSVATVLEDAKRALCKGFSQLRESHPEASSRIDRLRTEVLRLDAGEALMAEAEAVARFVLQVGKRAIEWARKFDLEPIKREAGYEESE